jgi:ABC-2 type transport system permease protein
MVRRDLLLFFADPRAVLVTIVVPIALAAVIGAFTGGAGSRGTSRIAIRLADLDRSEVSTALADALAVDAALEVRATGTAEARDAVRRGKAAMAVVIPAGFGEAARGAFFGSAPKPVLPLLRDPSRAAEAGLVRGVLTQHVMEVVSGQLFDPGSARKNAEQGLARIEADSELDDTERASLTKLLEGVRDYFGTPGPARTSDPSRRRGGLTVPFTIEEESVAAPGAAYNAYSHSFAGMGVQFVLFLGLEAGLTLLEQRRRGLWDRVRAAPVARRTVLFARTSSGAVLALLVLFIVMGAGAAAFGVRVHGSVPGLLLVCAATALMVAAFGLLVAALGRTPEATRGLGIFATLLMTLLGGAWFPTFLFPPWAQRVTMVVPTRWAMDGLDGMTWRGLGVAEALPPAAVLLGFAALFGALAAWRFRWEADR